MNQISSLSNFARNIGGSAGTALLTTYLARSAQVHQLNLASHLSAGSTAVAAQIQRFAMLTHSTFAAAQFPALAQIYGQMQRQAMMLAYKNAFAILAANSSASVAAGVDHAAAAQDREGRPGADGGTLAIPACLANASWPRISLAMSTTAKSLGTTRRLGNSDLNLTSIGFGAWAIGGGNWQFAWGAQDDNDSIRSNPSCARRRCELDRHGRCVWLGALRGGRRSSAETDEPEALCVHEVRDDLGRRPQDRADDEDYSEGVRGEPETAGHRYDRPLPDSLAGSR